MRLAYTQRDAHDAHKPQFLKGIRATDWAGSPAALLCAALTRVCKPCPDRTPTTSADVMASPPIDWALAPLRPYYKCCGLPPGHDMIEFDKDCKWDNFMSPNFTAVRPYARVPKPVSIEATEASRWQVEAATSRQQQQQPTKPQPAHVQQPHVQQPQQQSQQQPAEVAPKGQEWPAFRGE